MTAKHSPYDYEMIRLWGETLGSHRYYVVAQQELAATDNAPVNATYKRDGVWHTTDDIESGETRIRLGLPLRSGDE